MQPQTTYAAPQYAAAEPKRVVQPCTPQGAFLREGPITAAFRPVPVANDEAATREVAAKKAADEAATKAATDKAAEEEAAKKARKATRAANKANEALNMAIDAVKLAALAAEAKKKAEEAARAAVAFASEEISSDSDAN